MIFLNRFITFWRLWTSMKTCLARAPFSCRLLLLLWLVSLELSCWFFCGFWSCAVCSQTLVFNQQVFFLLKYGSWTSSQSCSLCSRSCSNSVREDSHLLGMWHILWYVSTQSFSFSQVLDLFPLDPIGEVPQKGNSCFRWSFERYYFLEYECFALFHSP
jgi:hypothetical protein